MMISENCLRLIDSIVSDQRITILVLGALYMVFAVWVWQSHFAAVRSCLHQDLMSYSNGNLSNSSDNTNSTKSGLSKVHYHENEKERMNESNPNVILHRNNLRSSARNTHRQTAVISAFVLLFIAEIWVVLFICFPSWWQLLYLQQKLEALPAVVSTIIEQLALSRNIGFTATGNLSDVNFFKIFVHLLLEGWIVKGVHYTLFQCFFSVGLGHLKMDLAYEEDLIQKVENSPYLELQKLSSQSKLIMWNRLPHVILVSNVVTFLLWLGLRLIPGFSSLVVMFVIIANILLCSFEYIASYKASHSSRSIYLE